MRARNVMLAAFMASAAAMVGVLLVLGNSDDSPYGVRETLPHMVSDFRANARVADIRVSPEDVVYEVIAADGLVHVRDYNLRTYGSRALAGLIIARS